MRLNVRWLDRLLGRPTGICPECAHSTRLDQTYCQVCGYEIIEQVRTDIARMKPV